MSPAQASIDMRNVYLHRRSLTGAAPNPRSLVWGFHDCCAEMIDDRHLTHSMQGSKRPHDDEADPRVGPVSGCHASVHDWHGKAWTTTAGQKRADLWDTFSVRSLVFRVLCECVWIERGTLDGEAWRSENPAYGPVKTVELRGAGHCIMYPPRNICIPEAMPTAAAWPGSPGSPPSS